LAQANALVGRWHRHHKPVRGHRFSLGCEDGERGLVGAVIVGRPVARMSDAYATAEVTRLVTDGTKNACSMLYQAAARVAKEMGFTRIQTFILATEPGTSLKASGWICEGTVDHGQWNHTSLKQLILGQTHGNRTDQPTEAKQRWARTLATR
jgi:hypothetical protein